jgi:hypothetical protein
VIIIAAKVFLAVLIVFTFLLLLSLAVVELIDAFRRKPDPLERLYDLPSYKEHSWK